MKPHEDPANCPNRVEVTTWNDRHPKFMCGCRPNVVKVRGYWSDKQKRWFYTAECKQCGSYGSSVSASLFNIMINRADDHARHGSWKGWGKHAD